MPSFLQSAEWEQFERSLGRTTWRIRDVLVIRRDLPWQLNYLYCPRPASITVDFLRDARMIAREQESIFLKIDPVEQINSAHHTQDSIRPARAIQPWQTIVVNLADDTEAQLLAAMHEKTRYNIRLAGRKGVKIRAVDDFNTFWRLLCETAERDGFRVHTRRHYEALLEARSAHFSNELFFAEYQGDIVAGALVNFYKPDSGVASATYLHGASGRMHREVMAPHLLQWSIMEEAKRRGCATYDFWGIDEKRWPGVTRFKRGFGGREMNYPQSVDVIYRQVWYMMYAMIKSGKS